MLAGVYLRHFSQGVPAPSAMQETEIFDHRELEAGDQVVDSERSIDRKRPETGFLGERDQIVQRETKAERAGTGSADAAADLSLRDLGVEPHSPAPLLGESNMGSMTDDFLEDMEVGAHTLLNTREYAHWSYIHRIKRALAPIWKRDIDRRVNQLWASGRKFRDDTMKTHVRVYLTDQGALQEIFVVRSSGSPMLDTAAIEAFRAAGPFPNPPKQLVSHDGVVPLAWTFVVDQTRTRLTAVPSNRKPLMRRDPH